MTDETIQKLLSLFEHKVPPEEPTLVEARVIAPAGSDPRGVAIELSAARQGENKRVTLRGDHDGMRALGEALVDAVEELPTDERESSN
ncbi:hypothetical protein [Natrinema sp. SYSU A 869]|uniref:hypothetical protein n=1 Tax=Natrinema sp. SYSU A 869 TaxID=2871694 RepID=UPI001CA4522E|nr:hypothetical protein [Natrinema sp. SYSU A 869]